MNNLLNTPQADRDAKKQFDREVDRLAAAIQKFRVDSQRFFAGDLPLPPDELRDRIGTELRRLRGSSLKGAAASFRLGTLEAQFQSHLDLFGRRLRAREVGDSRAAKTREPQEVLDARQGVVVGPRENADAVAALYEGLYHHKPKMDLERFHAYIDRQAEVIRTKTGCREIQFRIAVQDGKAKLKAKPIRDSQQSRTS